MAKEITSYCGMYGPRTKLKNRAWELERESQRKKKLPMGSRAEREE